MNDSKYLKPNERLHIVEMVKLVVSWAEAHSNELPVAFLPLIYNLRSAANNDTQLLDSHAVVDNIAHELAECLKRSDSSREWHEWATQILARYDRVIEK